MEDLVPKFRTLNKIEFEDAEIYAGLIKDLTSKNGMRYVIIEPQMSKNDQTNFKVIKKLLISELDITLNSIKTKNDAARELKAKILELIKKYNMEIPTRTLSKITYYAIRDFVYLGKIEPLMRDHLIEEISCDGVNVPLYIWHREFESVPTNIIFQNDDELNNFVQKMSYVGGKHASLANPIVDAALPDGSRVNLTLGNEITKRGSTFTIRRFRADPITIVDLLHFKTISVQEAAYLWYTVENNSTMLVAGGTASGKTTLLNSLSSFIRPGQKIVSIEDTHELNLLHENWIPAVSRQNFTDGQIGEITQFDLLRAALRQRPDILIVGETRGREAYTLFQAMATGHGGFSSIHADSVEATLTRLVSSPMDVPKALIANTLDLITLQLKLRIEDRSIRRIIKISEIQGLDEKTGEIKTHDIFRWNPKDDRHEYFGNSLVLGKIKEKTGVADDEIDYELKKRKTALEWLVQNNIRGHKEVTQNILDFYSNSDRFYEKKRLVIE
ncbi:MAG: type IV secretory pathway protein [Nitrososphaeria archaeon]|nr:type IV secretory pathway protein [Nitrososphaeria archaeon]NDB51431.1 type IV secretory pathway protein [Nitrosopumilaceae archaeon]NDF26446.1 type IV secretory pathway protein [Nitrosopumilaceae archaeon]NDF47756.1 type IV secretory pathway protein [Nitrosopumilaceae archaeon]